MPVRCSNLWSLGSLRVANNTSSNHFAVPRCKKACSILARETYFIIICLSFTDELRQRIFCRMPQNGDGLSKRCFNHNYAQRTACNRGSECTYLWQWEIVPATLIEQEGWQTRLEEDVTSSLTWGLTCTSSFVWSVFLRRILSPFVNSVTLHRAFFDFYDLPSLRYL